MDAVLMIYISGFAVSFVIGICLTFLDSDNFKDLFTGIFSAVLASFFSWGFVLWAIIHFRPDWVDEFLDKKLPWKKGKE